MKNIIIRLRENIGFLNPAEKAVARYVLQCPHESNRLSVKALAARSFVSPAAVVRMCKSIGFEGFKEFKTELTRELATEKLILPLDTKDIKQNDTLESIIKKITLKNIHSLYDALRLIDPETIEKAVKLLQACDRILLFGLGASLIAAKDANLKFLRVNKTCLINDDWHLQLITARNSTSRDVGIVISYSGQTAETLTCAEILKHNNTPIIAITRCIESPISKLADVLLYTTSNESLFRSAAMSSRISQLNIIDILYTAFAVSDYEKNFTYLSKTRIVKHIPKNEREGEHHV